MREHSFGVTLLTIVSAVLLFAFLGVVPEKEEETPKVEAVSVTEEESPRADELSSADRMTLDDDTIPVEFSIGGSADNKNYSLGGGILTIKEGGSYYIAGTGYQIIVDVGQEYPVHLILSNVSVKSTDGPAIYAPSCSKLIITLQEDTENFLDDGTVYNLYRSKGKGTIHCKNSITINGTGFLEINATCAAGIYTKDDLRIVSGTIFISSMEEGIYGEDKVVMYDGHLSVYSEKEAIVSARSGSVDKGYVRILGGSVSLDSESDAIRAVTEITIDEEADAAIISAGDKYVLAAPAKKEEEEKQEDAISEQE